MIEKTPLALLLGVVLVSAATAVTVGFFRQGLPGYIVRDDIARIAHNIQYTRYDAGRDVRLEYQFTLKDYKLGLDWLSECKNGGRVDKYWSNGLPDSMAGFLSDVWSGQPCISREQGGIMTIICEVGAEEYYAYYHNV